VIKESLMSPSEVFAGSFLGTGEPSDRIRRATGSAPEDSHRLRQRLVAMLLCVQALGLMSCGSVPAAVTAPTPTLGGALGSRTPVSVASSDWTMYHATSVRSGNVPGAPDPSHLSKLWSKSLDGAVYAEPLLVAGRVIVATEHDSLYSLNDQTGQVQWKTAIGTPVPLSELPCGDIDPEGITGTPVFDPRTGLVFAVAEIKTAPSNKAVHILVGVDLSTGRILVRRQVDPKGTIPQNDQVRGALALYGDYVYVTFGGLTGDCADYHGLVVASRTDGTGPLLSFEVPTGREGGIWAPPGPVIDPQGNIFVAVGNGSATSGTWDHTDSVLRLSPKLQLEDGFAPNQWPNDNASDLDLGSMAPVLLPNGLVLADGKSGNGYLLRADHLGGVGGQLQTLAICSAYGGAATSGNFVFIPCSDGVREVQLDGGNSPQLVLGWKAPSQITGSPIVGGDTIYTLDTSGGTLYALNAGTGATRASLHVGVTSRFATPSLSNSTVYVGTMTGVVAVSID
jgi:outer membrane protein assembly factor BamB